MDRERRSSPTPSTCTGYPQEPVDTNGAGDTHTGVLVACRAAGASWAEAATRANAAGAIKVTRRGPATAPTAAEIDEFLGRWRGYSLTGQPDPSAPGSDHLRGSQGAGRAAHDHEGPDPENAGDVREGGQDGGVAPTLA